MANKTYQPLLTTSVTAGETLDTTELFIGVDGKYAGAGDFAVGVLDAATANGGQAPVVAYGIALITAGEAISPGDGIESAAGGKAAVLDTGVLLGYALDEATADGDIIRVKLV